MVPLAGAALSGQVGIGVVIVVGSVVVGASVGGQGMQVSRAMVSPVCVLVLYLPSWLHVNSFLSVSVSGQTFPLGHWTL